MDSGQLIRSDAFLVCRLLPAEEFQRYCSARGIDLGQSRLERLERMGLLFPFFRLKRPAGNWLTYWDAKTLAGLAADGHLWDPQTRPFQPWSTFRDENGQQSVQSFY